MKSSGNLPKWLFGLALLGLVLFLLSSNDLLGSVHASHLSGGKGCRRVIALTFDDGPDTPYTQQVLDILKANSVEATFFVEGQAAADHPEQVKALSVAGMEVGSHSYTHSRQLSTMDETQFRSDLMSADSVLAGILGQRPSLYRAPFGKTSTTMLRELRDAGYMSVGWDIDSTDWRETSPDKIAQKVLSKAHPGAIVLMHDGGLAGGNPDRTATIQALPKILAGLHDEDYELVNVSEILDPSVCITSSP